MTAGSLALATLGPTAFAILTWGAVLLVVGVFAYLLRVLVADGTRPE